MVVSAEVKNAGRNIEVNSINTVFGRDAISEVHDELVYTAENITPEQQALLDGNNPHQYPAGREQSVGKDSESSATVQGNGGKVSGNQSPDGVQAALAANQETDTEPTEAQKEAGAAAQGAGPGRRWAD